MSRRILSFGFIVFLFSLTGFGANGAFNSGNASNRNFDVNTPPAFSSTPPTASHPFGSLFTYDFSATDNDADEISFKVLGNEQVDANYQDSYNWATGYGPTRWQSFTAISSGILTKAGVLLSDQNTETVTVNIYNGSGNGGLLLYTTSLNMYNMADYWEISIPLSANVIVQAGQQYTIEYVSGSSGLNGYMKGDGSGPLNYYNDGSCDFSFYNTDYSFRVNIKPFTATPTVSWLNLTDNSDGTGSISGTPPPEAAGNFTFDIYAHSFTHYVKQTISFTIYDPTPSVPTGIYGVAGNGSVTLKWNKHSNNEVSKYYIYRGTVADPTELIDSTSSASDTTKLFTGLTNLTQYFFRVKAVSESGLISGYSANESVTPVDGFGNAIELNGSYQYVTIPGITELTGNSFTLETWVKRYSANSYQIIFGQGNINTSYGLHVGFRDNNVFTAAFYADDIDTQDQYPELTWVHWAFTYDSETNEKKIYRNGVEVGSGISSEDFLGSGDLYIGMSPWYDNFFHGQLDEARVWNYVRTESDVSENRITPLTGEESGLIALYHFDEISGSTVYDATKNGRNGTIVNGAGFVSSEEINLISLPVELIAFEAKANHGSIILNWKTATETNNTGWEIETRIQETGDRSQNTGWKKIGFVAGKGTTTEKQNYSFASPITHNESQLQFRLKQIDSDGKFSFSNILSVDLTPESFGLFQNYPNPFNPTTSISYQLKANSFVSLKVFDLLGREVKTLINEVKSAGSYSLNFSAVDLPSGVYFYKLTAGSFTQTKKMTVMK